MTEHWILFNKVCEKAKKSAANVGLNITRKKQARVGVVNEKTPQKATSVLSKYVRSRMKIIDLVNYSVSMGDFPSF